MVARYEQAIDGINYSAVVSDQPEALLAAIAAGSAVVGLWHQGTGQDLSMATYLVERPEDADPPLLEKAIRRAHGLPLQIAETKRLWIREFQLSDADQVPIEPDGGDSSGSGRLFGDHDWLEAYIRSQYHFFEYGIWALVDKDSHRLIGKAGITGAGRPIGGDAGHVPGTQDGIIGADSPQGQEADGLELGYHIFGPYRGCGYGYEACQGILNYVEESFAPPYLYLKTDTANAASLSLAKKLGFKKLAATGYNAGAQWLFRPAANC